MTLQELELEMLSLSPSDKARILQLLVFDLSDSWPGVEKKAGIVGGDARISGTRIPLWTLEGYRQLGWQEDQILENFPSLRATDLANAWLYIAAHMDEIEKAIRENDEDPA